jgi:hypothetical protein
MKKKIFTQIVFVGLIFSIGFAYGGYRGTNRQMVRSFVEEFSGYCMLYHKAVGQESEAFKNVAADGINVRVQILRELEDGVHDRDLWLNAFSLEDGMLDDHSLEMIIEKSAKYSITKVPGLTEENLAYLKSKCE